MRGNPEDTNFFEKIRKYFVFIQFFSIESKILNYYFNFGKKNLIIDYFKANSGKFKEKSGKTRTFKESYFIIVNKIRMLNKKTRDFDNFSAWILNNRSEILLGF